MFSKNPGWKGRSIVARIVLAIMVCLASNYATACMPDWTLSTEKERPADASPQKSGIIKKYKRAGCYFIENQGQVDPRIRYYKKGIKHAVYFSRDAIHFAFADTHQECTIPSVAALRMPGMCNDTEIVGVEPRKGKVNYFIGNDPGKWRIDIPTFGSVLYHNAYPDVDIRFYGQGLTLEYDVVVKPEARVSTVVFELTGPKSATITAEGDLVATLAGGRKLVQRRPKIYQEIDGRRIFIKGNFRIIRLRQNSLRFGFETGSYDHRYHLVIDPLVLVYSTYLGGEELDYGWNIAVDDDGNAYVAGYTNSPDFPLSGAAQPNMGGSYDAFVTKIAADGTLGFSTYFGGSEREYCNGIALDPSGLPTIVGHTGSADFPYTANPFQPTLKGQSDAYVVRLTKGGAIVFSTYLGGSGNERGAGIAVDEEGKTYIVGSTNSDDFPTHHPMQANRNGPNDIFVAKLSAGGRNLLYGTYFGGSSADRAQDIAIDGQGNVYIAGHTLSIDLPLANAIQPERKLESDTYEGFVTKFNSIQNNLIYSTYFAGSEEFTIPQVTAIASDNSGNTYLSGRSHSADLPIQNAFQGQLNGSSDAFFSKIDPGGNLVFSSYLGGSGLDIAVDIAADQEGNLYLTGITSSPDFPVKNAFIDNIPSTTSVFVTKVNATGEALAYSTYLGGSGCDNGRSIAVDKNGDVYVTGLVASADFPLRGAFQEEKGGGVVDAFAVKMREQDTIIVRIWRAIVQFIKRIFGLSKAEDIQ